MDPGDWSKVLASCPGGFCGPQPYTLYNATFQCEDGPPIQVGIRRKNGPSEPPDGNGEKPPLKIDVNYLVPGQTFAGKVKISLENGGSDALVSEGLTWLLYNASGLVASGAAWVNVHVNGELKGLYTNVEQVDKAFLTDHGIDNGGFLFKVEEQRTREGEPSPFAFNWYPFDHPIHPQEVPQPPDWREQAVARVNIPHLLTLAAVEIFSANTDGMISDMHNYWYYDWSLFPEGQQPRLYLAWDLDTTMRGSGTTMPVLGQGGGHLREGLLVNEPTFQFQYLSIVRTLLAGPLSPAQTLGLVNRIEPVIAPHIDADPWQTMGGAANEFQRIRSFLQARAASLQSELGDCPDGVCGGGENPCTCPADCGAAPSAEAVCTGGADEDCDAAVDCSDTDCAADLACAAAPPPNLVVVNEVLANTSGGDDIEFIEIHNAGPQQQDLTGWYVLDDDNLHDKCFLEGTLDPGDHLVVPGFRESFMLRFPEAGNVNPNQFDSTLAGRGFSLGDGGDQARLFRPTPQGDVVVHGFTFGLQGNDIPFGYVPVGADAPEYLTFATPGARNTLSGARSPVVINEFLMTSRAGGVDDWVELYNRGPAAVNIGGWFLSDEVSLPTKYRFPPGTSIPAGGFLTVNETQLGFGFSSTGSEVIMLAHSDGVTGMDYFDYGPQFPDVTQGRYPDGGASWHFFGTPTVGQPNVCSAAPLGPATNLGFTSGTTFSWDAVAGAGAYDVVRGDIGALWSTAGDFRAAVNGCLVNNVTRTGWWTADEPSAGQAVFYLVRGVDDSCGFGTYDEGSASQAGSRDAEIASSDGRCP